MPYVEIATSAALPSEAECGALLQRVSKLTAEQLAKPERYVMTRLAPSAPMSFDGDLRPCAFVAVRSIGAPTADQAGGLCAALTELLGGALGLSTDRVYVVFDAVDRARWGAGGALMG